MSTAASAQKEVCATTTTSTAVVSLPPHLPTRTFFMQSLTTATVLSPCQKLSPTTTPAQEIDIHSLQAPAGIEQPYLERMVPIHSCPLSDATTTMDAKGISAYGMGWSIVQGPPSLFAGTSYLKRPHLLYCTVISRGDVFDYELK
ncbi:hypothetical protein QFC19_009185 [Naganishia cerealis]|uniref:Uncharacterized protein n=1 Tax=Naganishia cerealis TaxID=610337 RepID=A0ACC2UX79_9TREE|nr:hypothetical protein QFC19_009185 [Naganishia cerealis]